MPHFSAKWLIIATPESGIGAMGALELGAPVVCLARNDDHGKVLSSLLKAAISKEMRTPQAPLSVRALVDEWKLVKEDGASQESSSEQSSSGSDDESRARRRKHKKEYGGKSSKKESKKDIVKKDPKDGKKDHKDGKKDDKDRDSKGKSSRNKKEDKDKSSKNDSRKEKKDSRDPKGEKATSSGSIADMLRTPASS